MASPSGVLLPGRTDAPRPDRRLRADRLGLRLGPVGLLAVEGGMWTYIGGFGIDRSVGDAGWSGGRRHPDHRDVTVRCLPRLHVEVRHGPHASFEVAYNIRDPGERFVWEGDTIASPVTAVFGLRGSEDQLAPLMAIRELADLPADLLLVEAAGTPRAGYTDAARLGALDLRIDSWRWSGVGSRLVSSASALSEEARCS